MRKSLLCAKNSLPGIAITWNITQYNDFSCSVAVEPPVAEDFVIGGFAHHQTALHRSARIHGGEEVRGHDRVDLDRHTTSRFGSRALVGGGVVGVRRRRHPHPAGLPLVEGECERNCSLYFIYRLVHSRARAPRVRIAGMKYVVQGDEISAKERKRHAITFFSPFFASREPSDLSR